MPLGFYVKSILAYSRRSKTAISKNFRGLQFTVIYFSYDTYYVYLEPKIATRGHCCCFGRALLRFRSSAQHSVITSHFAWHDPDSSYVTAVKKIVFRYRRFTFIRKNESFRGNKVNFT